MSEASKRSSEHELGFWHGPNVVRDALIALWLDRKSDQHRDLYARAMIELGAGSSLDSEQK